MSSSSSSFTKMYLVNQQEYKKVNRKHKKVQPKYHPPIDELNILNSSKFVIDKNKYKPKIVKFVKYK